MPLIENAENYGFNFTQHNYDDLNYCGCINWAQNPITIRRFVTNNNPLQNEALNSNAPIWSSSINLMFLVSNQQVIDGHLTQLNQRMTIVGPDFRQALRTANFPQLVGNPIYKYLITMFMYIFTTGYFRQNQQYYPNGIFRLYLEYETFMNLHKLFTNIDVSFCRCFLNYIYHLHVKYTDALNVKAYSLFADIIQRFHQPIPNTQISRIQYCINYERQLRQNGTDEQKREFLLRFLIQFNPHAHIYTYNVTTSPPVNQYNTNKWFSQFIRFMPIIQESYTINNLRINPPLAVIIQDAHAHMPLHNYYLYLRQLPRTHNVILQGNLDYLNFQHHSRYGCWAGLSFFKKKNPQQVNQSIITNEQWVNTFGRVLCRVTQRDNRFIVCNSNTELLITRKLYPRSIEFKGSNRIGTWPVEIDTTLNLSSKIHTYGIDELGLSYFLLDSRNKSKYELGHETYLDGMNVQISYSLSEMGSGDDLINSYIPNLTTINNYVRLCRRINNGLEDVELVHFYNQNIRNIPMKTPVPNDDYDNPFDPDRLGYNQVLQTKRIMLKNRTKLNYYDKTIYLSICKCIIIILLHDYKQILRSNNSRIGLVSIPNVLILYGVRHPLESVRKTVFTILNTVWGYTGYNIFEGNIISITCDLNNINIEPAHDRPHQVVLFNLMNYYINQFESTQYWFKSLLEHAIESMADDTRKKHLYSIVDRLLMDDFYT